MTTEKKTQDEGAPSAGTSPETPSDAVAPLLAAEFSALAHAYRFATPLTRVGPADRDTVEIARLDLQRLLATARKGVEDTGKLCEFNENVQQIRGELWDAVSYVPVDSEAADVFARAVQRAMEQLDRLNDAMCAAMGTTSLGRSAPASDATEGIPDGAARNGQ